MTRPAVIHLPGGSTGAATTYTLCGLLANGDAGGRAVAAEYLNATCKSCRAKQCRAWKAAAPLFELRPDEPGDTSRDPRLDEVVVSRPAGVHLEMMDEDTAVMIVDLVGGGRLRVRIWAECRPKRLMVKAEHER